VRLASLGSHQANVLVVVVVVACIEVILFPVVSVNATA
jgi:hypothetical protein